MCRELGPESRSTGRHLPMLPLWCVHWGRQGWSTRIGASSCRSSERKRSRTSFGGEFRETARWAPWWPLATSPDGASSWACDKASSWGSKIAVAVEEEEEDLDQKVVVANLNP